MQLVGVSHVSFEGITVAYSRNDGMQIINSSFVTVRNSTVMSVGATAIAIDGGVSNAILGCTIRHTGGTGVDVNGGDAMALSPSLHSIEDCTIHDFGRRCLTYFPGAGIHGIGAQLLRTEIFNGPHAGIYTSGNNHLFENNVIHHTVQQVWLHAPCTLTDSRHSMPGLYIRAHLILRSEAIFFVTTFFT